MRADKRLAAVCGLFCPACTVYIGTREDPERLKAIAGRLGRTVEELECHGCRGSKRCFHCESICVMAKCAANKGVDFCGQCPEYPCSALKTFQAAMPHRIELWKSQERIKEAGYETWYAEMIRHFSCPSCGTVNSVYDLKCRKCGEEPSCAFVREHKEEIVKRSRNMR
jgi:predicted RNA-binding Zn-ribbon protein involved in translation (DUF1610 family)